MNIQQELDYCKQQLNEETYHRSLVLLRPCIERIMGDLIAHHDPSIDVAAFHKYGKGNMFEHAFKSDLITKSNCIQGTALRAAATAATHGRREKYSYHNAVLAHDWTVDFFSRLKGIPGTTAELDRPAVLGAALNVFFELPLVEYTNSDRLFIDVLHTWKKKHNNKEHDAYTDRDAARAAFFVHWTFYHSKNPTLPETNGYFDRQDPNLQHILRREQPTRYEQFGFSSIEQKVAGELKVIEDLSMLRFGKC